MYRIILISLFLFAHVANATTFSDIIDSTLPSVVIVSATEKKSPSIITNIFEEPGVKRGTGFYVGEKVLVTSYHVVANSDAIFIQPYNNSTQYKARLLGYDSVVDIAVLLVDHKQIGKAVLWEQLPLRVGQDVFTVGHPFGFTFTVTKGILSYVERRNNEYSFVRYTQSDAAVNSGNSGGPLFNEAGNVIGVLQAIISISGGSNGIALATSPTLVQTTVLKILQRGGEVQRPSLGLSAKMTTVGIIVVSIVDGSAAEDSGILVGDVITKVDGTPVLSMFDLIDYYNTKYPKDIITIQLVRQGVTMVLPVVLGQV